jgi:hypothetical protein
VHYEHLPLSAASPILASPLIGLGKEGGSKDHQERLDFPSTNNRPVNSFHRFTFFFFSVTARDRETLAGQTS